ncbi:MAG: hypothetical protein Unbinned4944contig1000_16 [Prokaryotic dsDNA virus sp.]|nr:MAG: hypothetical protein Unbinned4944contig1000_16 [Prokaryotic dsDNA virus sp.]
MATKSYFGRNSFVGVAKEDLGWGTAEMTPDVTRPIISCSMLRQVEKVERPNLRVAGVAGLRKGHYIVSDKVTGSLELEATYDNMGFFLDACMGASATTGPASGLYEHTYTLGDVPTHGTTLRLQRGTSDYSESFEGVVFNTMSLSVTAGEHMTLSMDMIGETSNDTEGPRGDTTLSFSAPSKENLVLHHHSGTLGWAGQTFELMDCEFSLENGLSDRMRLGSLVTKQPTQSDYRSITMTVSFETDDVQGYKRFIDDDVSDCEVTFNNGAAGADNRVLQLTLNDAYIESYTDEISETGLVTASVTFKAQGSGDSGLNMGARIIVKNEANSAIHAG